MNLKNIEMVVFDMAGTTIDEQNIVYKTLHKAIVNFGVKTNLETVLMFGAGKEKHQAIKDVLYHLKSDKIESSQTIFENFQLMLDEAYEKLEVMPIKGVEKLLFQLKHCNIKIILNTGYNSKIANLLLNKLRWKKGEHYDALITADDVEKSRPHPEMIYKAMQMFKIEDASKVLKAGDSAIDIEEGKNANCGITVGVLSGAQTKSQLQMAKPTYIINSLAFLMKELGGGS